MTPLGHVVRDYLGRLERMLAALDPASIEQAAACLINAYEHNRTVFICGNGGSASTASHMAADLGKNTVAPGRPRLRVLSLNDNMAWFSALANDLGYEHVFVEQMENLLQPGDLLVAISARAHGACVVALVGFTGGRLRELGDAVVHLPSSDYGPVEDGHLVLNHIFTAALRDRVKSGS